MKENVLKEYKKRLVSMEDAALTINDGDRIVVATGPSQPKELLKAIAKRTYELKDVWCIGSYLAEEYEFLKNEAYGHINTMTTFMGICEREYYFKRRITENIRVFTYDFMNSGRAMKELYKPNVYVFESPEPDEFGRFSLGLTGQVYGRAAIDYIKEHGGQVIVQVNREVPFLKPGMEEGYIKMDEINLIVESKDPLFTVNLPEPTDIDRAIAGHILPYIHDGSTLQLGFGGIANAIGFSLDDRKHLGVHTEAYVDSMMYLQAKGVIDNSGKKGELCGISQTAFVMGSKRLYEYAASDKGIVTMPIHWITDTNNIAAIDNFISINSCMNADLTGQVGAESIGLIQMTSQGGQVAFVKGANLSKGGKSFLCMRSTNGKKGGPITSTIDIGLPYGTAVTTPRHDVDCIVTEWGCAELKYKPLNERAIEMINIAHPDFRQSLVDKALEIQLISKHQLKDVRI